MVGVGERELDALDLDGAALVRVAGAVLVDPLLRDRAVVELDRSDDDRLVLLPDVHGVADVVAVTVRDRDDVDPLGLLLVVGSLGVSVQERIDVDAFSARAVEAKARVPEPGELCVSHSRSLTKDAAQPGSAGAGPGPTEGTGPKVPQEKGYGNMVVTAAGGCFRRIASLAAASSPTASRARVVAAALRTPSSPLVRGRGRRSRSRMRYGELVEAPADPGEDQTTRRLQALLWAVLLGFAVLGSGRAGAGARRERRPARRDRRS